MPKVISIDISMAHSHKEPKTNKNDNFPLQALSRLSTGLKAEISKKDMLKLTSKNYEQLPEIKRRKLEE